ncbi:MAG: tRNA (adenosine(37)-N6)-threonylcarbamoyltransferase complex dimerization subunit type 1 TsaB [Clostridiales bacterium]|nr:tRNA (adenosine(37)-N6)-threonylcarbamoyltransferase complex dimerization subunit type 1 TsaB [Clostridiales bacterium]
MNILALDTSGPVAGCAVMAGGKIVYTAAMRRGLTHSETILPAVDRALSASGLRCADIGAFAAVAGPGSFTGVRIGVCMAKGFAHAVGRRCCAVNALEALAMNAVGFDGLVCPILDARRDQVYCAAFDMSSGEPVRALPDAALALDEFFRLLPDGRRLAFLGDGVFLHADAIRNALGQRAAVLPPNLSDLRADAACVLAERRPETWVEPAQLKPYYLRQPQAERERLAREGGA